MFNVYIRIRTYLLFRRIRELKAMKMIHHFLQICIIPNEFIPHSGNIFCHHLLLVIMIMNGLITGRFLKSFVRRKVTFITTSVLTDDEIHKLDEYEYDTLSKKSNELRHSTERGEHDVFDFGDLYQILMDENVNNLYCVTPYRSHDSSPIADYMVFGTCLSRKHVRSVSEYITRLHKKKKLPTDSYARWTTKSDYDWKVLDMGSIILHLFSNEEIRTHYNIERLWTYGPKVDAYCHEHLTDTLQLPD
ncbi:hypothetical protein ACOME3_005362 [Neoechinorhynchus agilis]